MLPVLEVDSGVRHPVAAKADLQEEGRTLVAKDRVYVRTLSSSGVVSTSEAKHSDFRGLSEICFSNREADVGGFLRRHLMNLSADKIRALGTALVEATAPQIITDSAIEFLKAGFGYYSRQARRRNVYPKQHGSFEIAVKVDPPLPSHGSLAQFKEVVMASNPRLSGWPSWADTTGFVNTDLRPYVFEGGWEALIVVEPGDFAGVIDFWRIEEDGSFYLRRALPDDVAKPEANIKPRTKLELGLQVERVTEALAVALGFVRALGAADSDHSLAIACRWIGLQDRELSMWAHPEHAFFSTKRSRQDDVLSTTVVPADLAWDALAAPVEQLMAPMFEIFEGFELPSKVYSELVHKVLARQSDL